MYLISRGVFAGHDVSARAAIHGDLNHDDLAVVDIQDCLILFRLGNANVHKLPMSPVLEFLSELLRSCMIEKLLVCSVTSVDGGEL